MQEILLILILLAVLAYWWDTMYTNERALRACQQLCRNAQTLLLDGTIVRQRVWLRRNAGHVQICRLYSFEYSNDSESRQQGYVVMLGHRIAETQMDSQQIYHQ